MRKLKRLLLLMPCASVFFMSCKNEELPPARLLVANMVNNLTPTGLAAPNNNWPLAGTNVDVKWGGKVVQNNLVYGAGTTLLSISSISSTTLVTGNYTNVASGSQPLNFAVSASAVAPMNVAIGSTLYNRIASLLPGRSYTAVTFDLSPFYNTVIMSDDLSSPPAGKAKIRFVHAIPQPLVATLPKKDTIDVTFTGGDVNAPIANVAVFPRRNFGDNYTNSNNSQFAVVDSGRYNIAYRVSGTPGTSPATGLLGLFSNIKLESGKIYTIFARLQFSATATPVYTTASPTPAATIITHN